MSHIIVCFQNHSVQSVFLMLSWQKEQSCAKMFAEGADRQRIAASEHQDSLSYKKAKIPRKDTTEYQQQLFEETEGLIYGPGIAD